MNKLVATLTATAFALPLILPFGSALADSVEPKTSTADFTIVDKKPDDPSDPNGSDGKLVLEKVPSFSFGAIKASEIYAGFTDKSAQADGTLEISDTRLGASDWTLTADMDQFADGENKLSGATLGLSSNGSLGETLNASIKDDSNAVSLVTGNGTHGVDNFNIQAANSKLSMAANPGAKLAKDEAFQATINWNLSSTTPVAPEA